LIVVDVFFNSTEFVDLIGSQVVFSVKGHSLYSSKGSDIVCSAVSALVQTACLAFFKLAAAEVKVAQHSNSYTVDLNFSSGLIKKEIAGVILDTMIIGLEKIQFDYSDNLRLSIKESGYGT